MVCDMVGGWSGDDMATGSLVWCACAMRWVRERLGRVDSWLAK
jgi:hypothetical protein